METVICGFALVVLALVAVLGIMFADYLIEK